MPKKHILNVRRRCASISLSPLHTQGVQTLKIDINHHTNYAKRTQKNIAGRRPATPIFNPTEVGDTPATQKYETNPIQAHQASRQPKKYETNPIYPTATLPSIQIYETNPIPAYQVSCIHQKIRNEPNLQPGHIPKNAKRTQFSHTRRPAAPYFCETNPIPAVADLCRTRKCETNPISGPTDEILRTDD